MVRYVAGRISKTAFPVRDPMMVSMIHTPASRTPKRLAAVQNVMTTPGLLSGPWGPWERLILAFKAITIFTETK